MILGDILKGVFGERGLAGGITDLLKDIGVLKDPEAIAKAQQALQEFEVAKGQQEIQVEQIFAEDRDSARKREIEIKDKTPMVLATVSVIGFFGILILLINVDIPDKAQNAMLILLGILGGMVGAVFNYYFGSSSGSAKKNDLIDKLMVQAGKEKTK